ncbi:MAG: hypothetical protein ACOYPR_05510 [Saprospiraceae bacterium]
MCKILPVLLLFISLSAHAQSPKSIQEDPKTDWAAIIELSFPSDPFLQPDALRKEAEMTVLKLSAESYGIRDYVDFSLNTKLWQMAKSEQWEMYADANLTRQMAFEEAMRKFSKPDTTLTFDPETYEERIKVNFEPSRLPFDAPYVRVRQLLSYHNASARFSIQTLAIGPCWEDGKVPYWLKIPTSLMDLPESMLDAADITWAVRYMTDTNSPTEAQWTEVKNTTGPVLQRFLDRIRTDTSIQLYDNEENLVLANKRPCLFSCTDTVVTFDPQTWKEHVQIIETGLDLEVIHDIQLVEEWFWDTEQGLLITRLKAVAPRAALNRPGDELLMQARFYRKCEAED